MQKITPFLWFDGKAEEAAKFYVSIFKNSKIGTVNRYGDHGPGPKGTVMIATFQIGRAGIHRAERRAAVQVFSGHFVRGELRDAGRSG